MKNKIIFNLKLNTNYLRHRLSYLFMVLLFSVFTFAQAPGGVTSGLAAWHRADVGVFSNAGTTPAVDGSTIQQWNDFNNNGVNLSQATAAARPTYTPNVLLNFNPTVRFFNTGTKQYMSYLFSGPATAKSQGTLYFASKQASTTLDSGIMGFGDVMNYPGVYSFGTNQYVFFQGANSILSNNIDINIPNIVGAAWQNGLGSTAANLLVNTRYNGFTQSFNNVGNITFADNIYRVGGDSDYGTAYNGNIGEFIYYSRQITPAEQNRIDSYLALKYGTTLRSVNFTTGTFDYLNSSGNVVWSASTNSGYTNNIAGIARDNASGLHQKQSMSSNTGSQVLIGNGTTLFNTNPANTNDLADGQFLIWGDNGGSKTLNTAVPGSTNVPLRFGAIWRVQNTGSVGTVTVAWPAADAISNLNLIKSNDATFNSSDTFIELTGNVTLNGVSYLTATVTFNDGEYFSFGGSIPVPGGVANGLALWYDAGVNATLTTWGAKNTTFNLTETGTGSPTLNSGSAVTNFNPYYTFPTQGGGAGSNFYGLLPATGSLSPASLGRLYTSFGVASKSQDIDPTYNHILRFSTSTNGSGTHRFSIGINKDGGGVDRAIFWFNNGGGTQLRAHPGVLTANQLYLISGQITSATGTNNKLVGLNGNFVSFTDNITADVYDYIKIGGNSFGLAGNIPEVIYYNSSLTNIERDRVNSYLGIKYGLTLSHDYIASNGTTSIWSITENPTFNNNITVIGRDNVSGLTQKQSKSVSPSSLVTISKAAITATNSANTSTFTNLDFLAFGNTTAAFNTFSTTGAPYLRQRIARTWYVKETGTDATYTISVPASTSSLASKLPAQLGAIYLIMDADGDFTSGSTEVQMTLVGTDWVATNVDLDNNQYFTFGTQVNVLTQIGQEADNTSAASTVTVAQMQTISPAITGLVAGNQTAYQDFIDANPNLFSSPATAAEVQAMVNAVNASQSVLAQIGNEGDAPDTVNSVVTVAQMQTISPAITGLVAANESAYQDYIDANPNLFSSPATVAEVQAMVNAVNASQSVLAQIGNEGDLPNTVPSVVTVAQINSISPAITGAIVANQSAYQAYIDANPNLFSSPATAAEVQAMVNAVNASQSVLAQIGNEGDVPDTVNSVVTVGQLQTIAPAITGLVTGNESAYQDYIDANPNLFSSPATAAEVQAMVNAVNASQSVLAQIGNEGDAPDTVSSVVTVGQLQTISPAITGLVAGNESAYQAYIDANPNLFSSPATAAEVQAMVNAVNASQSVLAQIGIEADASNISSVVTVAQINTISPVIIGAIVTNESAYQAYIDANPNLFSSPATAAEVQAMINIVNALSNDSFDYENNIMVYPNPASNYFIVKLNFDVENSEINVFDINGRIVHKQSIGSGETQISIDNLQDGIYLLNIIIDNKVFYKKIVKK